MCRIIIPFAASIHSSAGSFLVNQQVAWPVPLAIKTTRRDELVENSIFDRGKN